MASSRLLVLSIALTVGSNVLYHIAQKSIPRGVHPLLSVAVTYAVALLVTLLLWPVAPGAAPRLSDLSRLNWATIGVAVAIVGVEVGFLLAYRAGWDVSVGSLVVSAAVALLLVPVGIWMFGERLSAANAAGIVLSVLGLVLMMVR
jgi:drug/metabolite transporter (DMT)-like permease